MTCPQISLEAKCRPHRQTPVPFHTKQQQGHGADSLQPGLGSSSNTASQEEPTYFRQPQLPLKATCSLLTDCICVPHAVRTKASCSCDCLTACPLPQSLRSALPPQRTAHRDLLAVAGGDMADVWQLLQVLPGLVQKV